MRSLMGLGSRSALMQYLFPGLLFAVTLLLVSAPSSANPLPGGACCLPDGSCQAVGEDVCAAMGGYYMGDFATCDPNFCEPFGACCHVDGSCMLTAPQGCEGQFYGFDSCDPNPCPPCKLPCGSSACCLPNGACLYVSEEECIMQDGLVQGSSITCTPDPCATSGIKDDGPVPGPKVEKQSWGKIKSRFR
jgi:hypothetical protein